MLSDDPPAAMGSQSVALDLLPQSFSISTYLSPTGRYLGAAPPVITCRSVPIDGPLLACLALLEECRKKGVGAFYHLSPRQPQAKLQEVGHVSDLIFAPKLWTETDKQEWDEAGWVKRLDLFKLDGKSYGGLPSTLTIGVAC